MFHDRTDAGRQLARHLHGHRGRDTLVLALPRGGVVVGYEVAEALDCELDVLVVRKLGAPHQPEFGLGAIASHGARFVDEASARAVGVSPEELQLVEERERQELARRQQTYRGDREPARVEGRTVIVVDDGIATGGTARAAIQAIRSLSPREVVLAVPVAPPEARQAFGGIVDELVVLNTPAAFRAIGLWYRDFGQTTDDEVIALLKRRRDHLAQQE